MDSLGDRLKKYEDVNRHYVIPRMPVIIRIDGKSFHSWTKNVKDLMIKTYIFNV